MNFTFWNVTSATLYYHTPYLPSMGFFVVKAAIVYFYIKRNLRYANKKTQSNAKQNGVVYKYNYKIVN